MTDEELAAIKGRVEAATPGPWEIDFGYNVTPEPRSIDSINDGPVLYATVDSIDNAHIEWEAADAEFVAHAREDVPALLAEIGRLKREAGTESLADWLEALKQTDDAPS